ncbi:hypothetical protein RHMOL_Rhmol09G0057200 [Rhododendron molle]|uniref:Uncharacterized protein n=1 Tax=Rhododendron molle TaxID=49168 RepID=A0ACC0MBA8_RHOML|nr:hypothetical protein RHMOL_Rhmol09G0057200 [Rhododendron molle]
MDTAAPAHRPALPLPKSISPISLQFIHHPYLVKIERDDKSTPPEIAIAGEQPRNRLNCNRAEKLVFVHYNHRLLSRYRADYESFKNWDVFDGDANIEEPTPTVGERENVILSDSDDDAAQAVITPTSTAPDSSSTSVAATSSTLPPSALTEKTQAQMRLEKA